MGSLDSSQRKPWPQALSAALAFGNQIPSTLKTQPSSAAAAATAAMVDKFKVYMKTVNTLDWDAVNKTGEVML